MPHQNSCKTALTSIIMNSFCQSANIFCTFLWVCMPVLECVGYTFARKLQTWPLQHKLLKIFFLRFHFQIKSLMRNFYCHIFLYLWAFANTFLTRGWTIYIRKVIVVKILTFRTEVCIQAFLIFTPSPNTHTTTFFPIIFCVLSSLATADKQFYNTNAIKACTYDPIKHRSKQ